MTKIVTSEGLEKYPEKHTSTHHTVITGFFGKIHLFKKTGTPHATMNANNKFYYS